MTTIFHNFSKDNVSLQCIESKQNIFNKNSIIFSYNNSNQNTGIHVFSKKTSDLTINKGLIVQFKNTKQFDISGFYEPLFDSSDEKDKKNNTKHTLLFGNSLFRPIKKNIERELKNNNALSSHLKAELVEFFQKNSQIPPHCHGKTSLGKEFKEKREKDFGKILKIKENFAHPQLVYIVEGHGNMYLDLQKYEVKADDLIIYGENTLHGSISISNYFSFIHFGWKEEA